MDQKVIGFHQDCDQVWVADLACGHKRHVRHDPPLLTQAWVLDSNQRQQFLGQSLNCQRCDELGLVVAQAFQRICMEITKEAYLEAGSSGLCLEGQLEYILDQIKSLDLKKLSQKAIAAATTDMGTLTES